MRKIKFKAWDNEGKQMVYFDLFGLDQYYCFKNGKNIEGYPIMQFTGLHDKNGKEIYEGDIVKMNSYSTYGAKFECTQKVEYIGQGFNIGKTQIHWGGFDNVEVIGNIYENPELI